MQGEQPEQPKQPDTDEDAVQDNVEQDGDVVEVVVEDDQPEAEAVQESEAEPRESALARAITTLQELAKRNHDNYVRAVADGDNFRKRSKQNIKDAVERAEDKVVRSFLPVIDNLERALVHANEGEGCEEAKGLVEGVKMVQKQFEQTLERFGITSYTSLGEPFDPELHEAIQQIPSEYPANAVAMELHRGYKRANRLVRPAMVAVSLGPANDKPAEPESDGANGAGGGDVAENATKENGAANNEGKAE